MESGVGMKGVDSIGIIVVIGSAVKSTADVLATGNLSEGGVVKRAIVVKVGCAVVVSGRIEVDLGVAVEDKSFEGNGI